MPVYAEFNPAFAQAATQVISQGFANQQNAVAQAVRTAATRRELAQRDRQLAIQEAQLNLQARAQNMQAQQFNVRTQLDVAQQELQRTQLGMQGSRDDLERTKYFDSREEDRRVRADLEQRKKDASAYASSVLGQPVPDSLALDFVRPAIEKSLAEATKNEAVAAMTSMQSAYLALSRSPDATPEEWSGFLRQHNKTFAEGSRNPAIMGMFQSALTAASPVVASVRRRLELAYERGDMDEISRIKGYAPEGADEETRKRAEQNARAYEFASNSDPAIREFSGRFALQNARTEANRKVVVGGRQYTANPAGHAEIQQDVLAKATDRKVNGALLAEMVMQAKAAGAPIDVTKIEAMIVSPTAKEQFRKSLNNGAQVDQASFFDSINNP
jgi:hypothetical protein